MKTDMESLMRDILAREAKAIESIPVTAGYADAVELITKHVDRRGGKLKIP